MSSDEEFEDFAYEDDEGFGDDLNEQGTCWPSTAEAHRLFRLDTRLMIHVESESDPDVYDVLSPSIEGETLTTGFYVARD